MTQDELRKLFQSLPGKRIKGRTSYVQIADNPAIVTFGKYRGQLLSTLLEDTDYVQWIQQEPGMVEGLQAKYPIFGAELRAAIGAGTAQTPNPSPAPKPKTPPRVRQRKLNSFANFIISKPRPDKLLVRQELAQLKQRVDQLSLVTQRDDQMSRDQWKRTMQGVAEAQSILATVPADASESVQKKAVERLTGILATV
jgi:hypothetical protein